MSHREPTATPLSKQILQKYRLWKSRVIYPLLLILLITFYIQPLRDTLYPATAVMILGILFETLLKLDEHIIQYRKEIIYENVAESLQNLSDIVRPIKTSLDIDIIAITGRDSLQ